MTDLVHVGGISVLYENTAADRTIYVKPSGTGSVYTYKVYGTAGQTAEVRGGFAGDEWEDMEWICTLTVGGTQSAVLQHTWPVLAVDGDAQVKIARGHA
ncbi:MAG: hypothetical protein VXW65_11930 [Pseudomonadota bacterium]|nr:hypothetical protein [Pseudomonadota bacterium]